MAFLVKGHMTASTTNKTQAQPARHIRMIHASLVGRIPVPFFVFGGATSVGMTG